MKILLSSYAFLPSVGGLEAVSAMLAEQFCLRGHEVVVITETPGEWEGLTPASQQQACWGPRSGYAVVRRPTKRQLLRMVRWCDVVLHNNINLRSAWPLLLVRRPWAIVNHGSIQENWTGRCKHFFARFASV